jgi:hypothetical protein
MVRNLIPSEGKRRKSFPCVLFASPCHKGPHGRSTKSNIVVIQDTQTGSDTNSLTDMDGAGISARRLEPNLNGIERKHCSFRKENSLPVWTNNTAGTPSKRSIFCRSAGR